MSDPTKTIIEINGVKLKVDLRSARRIENITVGSRVKVLHKQYDGYKVEHGVVIGFEPFKKLPTIIIACMEMTYNETKINFIYFNAESKDLEVVVSLSDDQHAIDKLDVEQRIDREIEKKQSEIAELQNRKAYFLSKFATYWAPVQEPLEVVA